MEISGTIALIAPTGKAVTRKVYCSKEDREAIINKLYSSFSHLAGFSDFQISFSPSLDHEASKQLGISYPQLKTK